MLKSLSFTLKVSNILGMKATRAKLVLVTWGLKKTGGKYVEKTGENMKEQKVSKNRWKYVEKQVTNMLKNRWRICRKTGGKNEEKQLQIYVKTGGKYKEKQVKIDVETQVEEMKKTGENWCRNTGGKYEEKQVKICGKKSKNMWKNRWTKKKKNVKKEGENMKKNRWKTRNKRTGLKDVLAQSYNRLLNRSTS